MKQRIINSISIFIAGLILLSLFVLLADVFRNNAKVIYASRDLLENTTAVFEQDFFRKESKLLFSVDGDIQKMLRGESGDYYYIAEKKGERSIIRRNRESEDILFSGRLINEFILSKNEQLLVFQILDEKVIEVEPEILEVESASIVQNIAITKLLNLETNEIVDLYEVDALEQELRLLGFSEDNELIYFDSIASGATTSGEFNILNLEDQTLLQTWKSSLNFDISSSPWIHPNQDIYLTYGQEVKENIGQLNVIKTNLETGFEDILFEVPNVSLAAEISAPIWSENDDDILYLSINQDIGLRNDNQENQQGVWRFNLTNTALDQIYSYGNIWAVDESQNSAYITYLTGDLSLQIEHINLEGELKDRMTLPQYSFVIDIEE